MTKDNQNNYTDEDKHFLLTLLSIDGLGRKTVRSIFYYLKKHEVKYSDFWAKSHSLLQKFNLKKDAIDSINKFNFDKQKCSLLKLLEKDNIRVVFFWEKTYPALLKECADYPLLLFVQGNESLLRENIIAVVGSRRMTSYGEMVTKKLVSELVAHNLTIASGFMYGVDLCAHRAALENFGKTVAVLGYGFDHYYPSSLKTRRVEMLGQGVCFVSEYFPWIPPNKGLFPERNRIVAGMSLGVLVTEAATKSGTHITAECAINEGREVFAVPGPITNPYSQGTKWLINQGAKLVTSGEDIITELRYRFTSGDELLNKDYKVDGNNNTIDFKFKNLDENSIKILQELSYTPKSIDQLTKVIKLSLQETLVILSSLEVDSLVVCEGQLWQLAM